MRPKGSFSFLGNDVETTEPLHNLLLHGHNVTNAMLQAKPEHTRKTARRKDAEPLRMRSQIDRVGWPRS